MKGIVAHLLCVMNTRDSSSLASTIIKAVWCSIALGLVVQAAIVIATTLNKQTLLPDTAQKVSWSLLVCTALAIGNAVAKSRIPVVGIVGLLAAPAAFVIAKTVQKSLSQGASAGASIPTGVEMAIVKAVEYGLFGALVAWVSKRERLSLYLLVGAALGAFTAAYVVVRSMQGNAEIATNALIARAINELLFPIGCAFVLWFTSNAGRLLAREQAPATSQQ